MGVTCTVAFQNLSEMSFSTSRKFLLLEWKLTKGHGHKTSSRFSTIKPLFFYGSSNGRKNWTKTIAKLTVKSQRKPSKLCLGSKPRRFCDHKPWFLVKSMELACNSGTNYQHEDQGGKCCLRCQSTASLSPPERLLQNRTRLSQLSYFKETPFFSVLTTILSGVARKINGPQLRPSPLSSPSLQSASAPSCAACTDLCCYSAPALCLKSLVHPAMCLLSTPLIRNVSATSLSLPDLHLPCTGTASTILWATLISKTEGLTLLASHWDSSWSLSSPALQCFSSSLKTCSVLWSSWLFP